MKKVAFFFGVLFWGAAVFLGTFYLTFPSEAIALRLRYLISERFDGYTAEIGSVSPWWLGLSVSDVKLYREVSAARTAEEGEPAEGAELAALIDSVKVRVSPWSLLRRAPYVSGAVGLPGGEVSFTVGTAINEEGDIGLSDLVVNAEQLPLEDLLMLAPNATASGTGNIDIDIDLHAGAEGMRDAAGRIAITGASLELSEVEFPGVGDLGMVIPISALNLAADVAEGKATFSDAHIDSEMAKIKFEGDLSLRDPIGRSAIDARIIVSDLGGSIAGMASMALKNAKQDDGTYLYSCHGVITRLTPYSCSEGERRTSSARPPRTPGSNPRTADAEPDADRDRRREEIRERLRQRREERERERSGGATPPLVPSDGSDPIDEVPEVIEEPDVTDDPEGGDEPEEPIE